jgi:23S rRNA pseudouridine2605 synthase
MAERLQKLLSQWGVASRRQAEQMIRDGRIRLNGQVVQLGQVADPECDRIEVDGQPLTLDQRPNQLYLLFHKPAGIVTTCHDPWNRPTVLNLLPHHLANGTGLHPVGRLDADSTGALLLTNDGQLTFTLTHPRHSVPKTYEVWVKGNPSEHLLQKWRDGVVLSGRRTRPAVVNVLARHRHPSTTQLEVILKEGRNRQIRRVAEQLGHPVTALHRTAIGAIALDMLAVGQYRPLTPHELHSLYSRSHTN